jgi:hypothetical protein
MASRITVKEVLRSSEEDDILASLKVTKNFSLGTKEVLSLKITNKCTKNGFIDLKLKGKTTRIQMTTSLQGDVNAVAAKIRDTSFDEWNTSGTGDTVIFTAKSVGVIYGENAIDYSDSGVFALDEVVTNVLGEEPDIGILFKKAVEYWGDCLREEYNAIMTNEMRGVNEEGYTDED